MVFFSCSLLASLNKPATLVGISFYGCSLEFISSIDAVLEFGEHGPLKLL